MKKTLLIAVSALILGFSSLVKAEMTLSGYAEFFAGSADQSKMYGADNTSGIDLSGMDNGSYTRVTANYSSTLDSGIDVAGTMNVSTRDCQGDKTNICNVVDFNFVTLSGGFGAVSIGERFAAGHAMMSRLTASGPMSEPDGAVFGNFYTGGAGTYGSGNEVNYANNSMKILYSSNVFSGFSFAASYAPNTSRTGLTSTNDGQQKTGTTWASFNDLLSVFGKYAMEMDGVGLELVYGQQIGNAGQVGTNAFNDLDETAYSAKVTYGNFSADYRKNEAGDAGQIKNNNAGNNEGTSVCGVYNMGNIGIGACQVETKFTNTSNQSESATTRTYSAEYQLGGGMKVGATYIDIEQVANGVTDTDVDGIMTRLAIGF